MTIRKLYASISSSLSDFGFSVMPSKSISLRSICWVTICVALVSNVCVTWLANLKMINVLIENLTFWLVQVRILKQNLTENLTGLSWHVILCCELLHAFGLPEFLIWLNWFKQCSKCTLWSSTCQCKPSPNHWQKRSSPWQVDYQ